MNVLERRAENQVQFWSLLGPFLILLSIAVLLFKVSNTWYFPFTALVGIPLCVKWKMKGMGAALTCLFAVTAFAFQSSEPDERYWHIGMGMAMALSFFILTRSLEEVEGVVDKLKTESQSRLDNFLHLDEKLKAVENEWIEEKQKNFVQFQALTQDIAKAQEEKQTFYKLAQLAKDELLQIRGQHDQLLLDFNYKKQQLALLQERFDETELTLQNLVSSDSQQKIKELSLKYAQKEQENETHLAQFLAMEEKCLEKEKYLKNLQCTIETLESREKMLLQEKLECQKSVECADNKCIVLEKEKSTLLQALNYLQSQYDALSSCEKAWKEKEHSSSEKEEEIVSLHKKIMENQAKIEEMIQQLKESEQVKENLQLQLNKLNKELEEINTKQLAISPLPDKTHPNARRVESMYAQLQEQFREKSRALDEARQALFSCQERLTCLEKEREEKELFGLPENQEAWENTLACFEKESQETQNSYLLEIEELSKLIQGLLNTISGK